MAMSTASELRAGRRSSSGWKGFARVLMYLIVVAGLAVLVQYADLKPKLLAIKVSSEKDSAEMQDVLLDFTSNTSATTNESNSTNAVASLVLATESPVASLKTSIKPLVSELRVVCVVMKNEAPFLKEWIDFHLLAGWTKFALYDHNSTDNSKDIVNQYPPGVVDWIPIDWQHSIPGEHRSAGAQNTAYPKCAERYWKSAQVVTTFDIDEFVFPAKRFWNDSDPFASAAKSINGLRPGSNLAVAAELQCYRFGYSHLQETPKENVVSSYTRRAAYTAVEQTTAADVIQRSAGFCGSFRHHCPTYGSQKHLYFTNGQTGHISPNIHGYSGGAAFVHATFQDRNQGFDCNHIWIRSMKHLSEKGEKNGNPHYIDIGALPADHVHHQFYLAYEDTLAVEFRQQALERYRRHFSDAP